MSLADFKAERPERATACARTSPTRSSGSADLVTDAKGTATVKVSYPDSLTTWRVTARAVTEDTRLGAAVARTTTTKDVIVRVATPRFLTEGDTVTVPVVAHNYLPESKHVQREADGDGCHGDGHDTPTAPLQVDIPSQGREPQQLDLRREHGGPGGVHRRRVRVGHRQRRRAVHLPVLPYGLVRENGVSGTRHRDGGTDRARSTFPTPPTRRPAPSRCRSRRRWPGTMLGAVDYLTGYPYGCTEQTLSSFLPNLLVMRTLSSLKIPATERTALAEPLRDGRPATG